MSTSNTFLALRAANKSRSLEEKRSLDNNRDCLVLILSYLQSHGYIETASILSREAGSILSRYELADNISLLQMLLEYEEFCQIKFGRKTKISRKVLDVVGEKSIKLNKMKMLSEETKSKCSSRITGTRELNKNCRTFPHIESSSKEYSLLSKPKEKLKKNSRRPKTSVHMNQSGNLEDKNQLSTNAIMLDESNHIHSLEGHSAPEVVDSESPENEKERIIKPLPTFGGDNELRSLASSIQREILDHSPCVKWDHIVDLNGEKNPISIYYVVYANIFFHHNINVIFPLLITIYYKESKRLLKEAAILPLKYPELFSATGCSWRGILLYG